MPQHSTVVFDLGGVLIDWNPRHLYRKLFGGDEQAMEAFLANVCTPSWNLQQDAGRPLAEAYALLVKSHPQHRALIEAWGPRFDEMMSGQIDGTVEILSALRARKTPLYALSNWSVETFDYALRRFEFLQWFDGIVISGKLKFDQARSAHLSSLARDASARGSGDGVHRRCTAQRRRGERGRHSWAALQQSGSASPRSERARFVVRQRAFAHC